MSQTGPIGSSSGSWWEEPQNENLPKNNKKIQEITKKTLKASGGKGEVVLEAKTITPKINTSSPEQFYDHFENQRFIKGFSYLQKLSPQDALDLLERLRLTEPAADRIIAFTNALQMPNALPEKKPLSFHESLKIACIVEEHFAKESEVAVEHLSITSSGSPRALVLDHNNQQFLVLSKEHGDLNIEGAERKVSRATLFKQENERVTHKRYVRLTNIEEEDIEHTKKEIELAEQIHGDILFVVEHTTKSGKEKISIFEEEYETNVEKIRTLLPSEIHTILQSVISTTEFLHTNGYLHGDINRANIVVKGLDENLLKAKLTDFGMTYSPDDDEMPRRVDRGYGSRSYSSPESFGASTPLDDSFEQGQADDLFAIGCTLYLMLFPEEKKLPWGPEADLAIEDPANNQIATIRFKKAQGELKARILQEADPDRKKLMETALGLLEPDPAKRMTLESLKAILP